MTIERLSGVLTAIGAPATTREIAEMLWLGCHITPQEQDAGDSRRSAGRGPEDSPPPRERDRAPEGEREPRRGPTGDGRTPDGGTRTGLFPRAAAGPALNAGQVLVPAAPMIGNALAIERALRPLKRTVPSEHDSELDEDATAHRIADQPPGARDWVPVLRQARERWLSLAFVVDTGPSMQVWQPMAEELREVFARLAAFRDLRTWYLRDGEIAATPGGLPQHPAGLISPASRQAVVVLSDCSGPHWWGGRAQRALSLWSDHAATAILQPLSERLWRRTALPPVPGVAFLKTAGAPNTELVFRPHDAAGDAGTPVPVVEISADWLADWASLLLGPSGSPVQAAACFVSRQGSATDTPLRRERQLPIAERVRRFQETASPEAVWLASCLAVSVPTLPVLRLIQHQMLGGRRGQPSQLAEVLLSGLLRPRDERRQAFEFVAGAREALIASMPRSQSWYVADVLSRISAEIEARAGRARDTFSAFQRVPEGTGGRTLRDDQPFALVAAEAIQYLRRSVAPAPPPRHAEPPEGQPSDDPRTGRAERAPEREREQAREEGPAAAPSATGHEAVSPDDVYLSYVQEERAWADWIAAVLEQRGIRVIRPQASLLPDDRVRAAAERATAAAGRTIAILSAHYLGSPHAEGVSDAMNAVYPSGAGPQLIPVRIDETPLESHWSMRMYLNLAWSDATQATEDLLTVLGNPPRAADHLADPEPHYPRSIPLVRRVPTRNAAFTGRNDVLEEVHDLLFRGGAGTSVVPVALHGLAGVGKSEIALEYAYRFMAEYDLVWWVPSARAESITSNLTELAAQLGIERSGSKAEIVAQAREALRVGRPFDRWLLIFDNADEPEQIASFIPGGPGHVLITSQDQAWSQVAASVAVDVFSRAESVAYLRRQLLILTDEEVGLVAEALGDLPVAIVQAGAQMAATGMPATAYVEQLREHYGATIDLAEPGYYRAPLRTTLMASFDRLRARSPAAARLLELCACFGPDPISLTLLNSEEAIAALAPYVSRQRIAPSTVGRLIADIAGVSLARVDREGSNSIEVHRLVQATIRDQLTVDRREATLHEVHRILADARPRQGGTDDPENWARYDLIWPHLGPSEVWACDEAETRRLLIDRVRYLWKRGDFESALETARDLERRWQQKLGTDDQQVLFLRFHIANVLRSQGRFHEAYELDSEVYRRQQAVLGEDHPATLLTRGSLGGDLRGLGPFHEAWVLDEEIYRRNSRLLGLDHPNTLSSANNLAIDLRLAGDPFRARDLDTETRDRRLLVLGPDHPDTLHSASMLARDLREAGDYQRSVDLLQQTYDRYRTALGEDFTDTLRTGKSLAVSLRKLGRFADAHAITSDVENRYQRVYGPDHPDTLACRLNLAADLSASEYHSDALAVGLHAVRDYQRLIGPSHPFTLAAENNVFVYLRQTGALDEAYALARRTMAALADALGGDHPFTLACAVNEANCLHDLGRLGEAEGVLRATRDRLSRTLGDSHPDTLACAENLSVTLQAAGRTDEAAALRDSAISTLTRTLGEDHPLLPMLRARWLVSIELEVPPV